MSEAPGPAPRRREQGADAWQPVRRLDVAYQADDTPVRVGGLTPARAWRTVAALAARHGVRPARLADLRAAVNAAVGRWEAHAAAAQVPPASAAEVAEALGRRDARLARERP